jgi:hypothetical protein
MGKIKETSSRNFVPEYVVLAEGRLLVAQTIHNLFWDTILHEEFIDCLEEIISDLKSNGISTA